MTSHCCDKLQFVRSWSHIPNLQSRGNALLWLHVLHVSPCMHHSGHLKAGRSDHVPDLPLHRYRYHGTTTSPPTDQAGGAEGTCLKLDGKALMHEERA